MADSFNSKTVSKILGIPLRVVDYWDRTNFIKPSVHEASGYGSMRLYSFTDLIQFKVAKFLRDQGLSLQKIRKSLNYLRKHLPEIEKPLVQLRFLTDGETIFVLTNKDREIIDTLKKGQYVFAIAIGELINDLKGKTSTNDNGQGLYGSMFQKEGLRSFFIRILKMAVIGWNVRSFLDVLLKGIASKRP